uniref:Uncharacterized protein n=1 Tax=Timema genevievae TaxID=629358 RepID=A0A7R9PQB6_TIMGE|nr:unnamed protein product [Timema genevievae]
MVLEVWNLQSCRSHKNYCSLRKTETVSDSGGSTHKVDGDNSNRLIALLLASALWSQLTRSRLEGALHIRCARWRAVINLTLAKEVVFPKQGTIFCKMLTSTFTIVVWL